MITCRIEPLSSPSEIDDILAVEEASFSSPWTREMYLAELNNVGVSYFYLARTPAAEAGQPDAVIGFCSFWRVLDELHINNLAVLPAYRRSGIGAALLRRVLEDGARLGAKRATLEVRRSNDAARMLYEKFGFSIAGVRRGYYTNPPEDALVLWRDGLP
jgi:[ribosomal protein S18]-alanine N-acetyltransferase